MAMVQWVLLSQTQYFNYADDTTILTNGSQSQGYKEVLKEL